MRMPLNMIFPALLVAFLSVVSAINNCGLAPLQVFDGSTKTLLLSQQNCGTTLNATNFKSAFIVNYPGVSSFENYTLMFLGRNATHLPGQYYLHFLVTNIHTHGPVLTTANSTTVAGYIPPEFPQNGTKDYSIQVWRQKSFIPLIPISYNDRMYFSPEKWLQEKGPSKIQAVPIAGTEFKLTSNKTGIPNIPPLFPPQNNFNNPVTKQGKNSASTVYLSGLFLVAIPALLIC